MEDEKRSATAEAIVMASAEGIELLSRTSAWRDAVPGVLAILGVAAEASRVYLFENSTRDDGEVLQDLTFEWTAPGVSGTIEDPYNHDFPYSEGWSRIGGLLAAGEVAAGPVSTFAPTERVDLEDEGVLSAALVPVFDDEAWWGYLGFDDCVAEREWSGSEIAALRAAAAAIGSAITRERLHEERQDAERSVLAHAQELHESQVKYRSLIEQLPAIIYIDPVDENEQSMYVSPQVEDILGCTPHQWFNDYSWWHSHVHPEDEPRVWKTYVEHRESGEALAHEYRMVRDDARVVWIREQASVLRSAEGDPLIIQGLMYDITEQKNAEEELAYAAQHDPLTGLPNRPMFEAMLDLALARARRGDLGVAVLCLDVDNFKLVNDSLGHAAGDELLQQLSERMRDGMRDTDLLARQGGDEFLVLLADIPSGTHPSGSGVDDVLLIAESVVTRIQDAFAAPFQVAHTEAFATASIGISLFPSLATDALSLLRQADAAMYSSKKTGPGGYAVFSTGAADAIDQLAFTTRLRKAVEAKVWSLHYQPLVELASGRMVGVEALLRWEDGDAGFIPPGDFIPLAEEMGLIVTIGDWVMEELFRQTKAWRDQGIELAEISFNISPRQLWEPDLVGTIFGHLDANSIDAGGVVVEITESTVMTDPEEAERLLWELHGRQLRLAIDDFGTGYSSLSRLKQMPVSILKIDRAFVKDLPDDHNAGRMVSAIIGLADSLEMRALAEGIETEAQRAFLLEKGCELGQGYYFSRPVPAEGIEEIHRRGGITVMADDTAP